MTQRWTGLPSMAPRMAAGEGGIVLRRSRRQSSGHQEAGQSTGPVANRPPLAGLDVLLTLVFLHIGNRMVAAELDEAFVECVSDHVVVVGTRSEGTEQKGFELKGGAHAAELEVPEPELLLAELSVPPEFVEHVVTG